jgi:hypothetical protein
MTGSASCWPPRPGRGHHEVLPGDPRRTPLASGRLGQDGRRRNPGSARTHLKSVSLDDSPATLIIAGLLVVVGLCAAVLGARRLAAGLRQARALELVRGIRWVVVALVAGLAALGVVTAEPGYLVLGAVILGEELYETGVLALIIRLGERG